MKLTDEHISFIIKDLHGRGIILEGFQEEVIDHVCSAVEERMKEGERFADAYRQVLRSFGNTKGLQRTQKETSVITHNKKIVMIQNYMKIALRHIMKGGLYTAVNISTLAIGIASTLLIALYVHNELSYDRWNPNADRIYRVDLEIKFNENHVRLATTPAPFVSTMQHEYPEIEATVRLANLGSYLVRRADLVENSREDNVAWSDSTFFKVFPVAVLQGNEKTALTQAGSVALSRRAADKYFPAGDALGKNLILDNKHNVTVTAIYENIPENTHFHFDVLIALVGDAPMAQQAQSTMFVNESFNSYVLLREGADAAALQAKMPGFVGTYVAASIAEMLGPEFSLEKFLAAGNKYEANLKAVTDIHLDSDRFQELEANSSYVYVYMFEVVGALILIIACVNFMNLSTARSTRRAREVGVRKAMGSLRTHLMRQFLAESIALTLFSVVVAVLVSWALLPVFNELSSKQLSIPFQSLEFYGWVLLGSLTVGIAAGLYPAVIISSFKTSEVLKGRSPVFGGGLVRNGLVVFQFMISILLIVGTITVNRQLNYIQNKRLGYDKSHVIMVKNGYALRPNAESFKTEALRLSGVEDGTMSGYVPVSNADASRSQYSFWKEGQSPLPENLVNIQTWNIDEDYISTFGMEIIQGRGFSKDRTADKRSIILSETALKLFDLGSDPVGKRIQSFADSPDGSLSKDSLDTYTVVGVVRDFHYSSLKENIYPVAFVLSYSDGAFSFKFKASQTTEVIAGLEKVWKGISPGQPFQYSFLDQDFENMYAGEQRLGNIFQVFTTLAIIIACLGLFALTAFTAEQRTKEIGIRKVLGASVSGIVLLLSKGFGKLILLAFVLSMPIAWYAVKWWLTSYSYRTDIGLSVYLLAAFIIAVIACIAMSFQSIKAALTDPVKALRSE